MTSEELLNASQPQWITVTLEKMSWEDQLDHICQQIKVHAVLDGKFRSKIEQPRVGKIGKLLRTVIHEDGRELSLTLTFDLEGGQQDKFAGRGQVVPQMIQTSYSNIEIGPDIVAYDNDCGTEESVEETLEEPVDEIQTAIEVLQQLRQTDGHNEKYEQTQGDESSAMTSQALLSPVVTTSQSVTSSSVAETQSVSVSVPSSSAHSSSSTLTMATDTATKSEWNRSSLEAVLATESLLKTSFAEYAEMRWGKKRKEHKCEFCNKTFPGRPNQLANHRRSHTGEKPFLCELCGKTFPTVASQLRHKRMHAGIKPHHCDICNKAFRCKDSVKQHRRVHMQEKPFQCQYCDRKFSDEHAVEQHIRVHTGEKPYQCDECGKTFARSNSIRNHKRSSSCAPPGYHCDTCGKAFKQAFGLTKHKHGSQCKKQFSVNGESI